MEPPARFDADAVRDEKVKVLRSLRRSRRSDGRDARRARPIRGRQRRWQAVPGYREETRSQPDSTTETFVALQLQIDNWRWAGVPFYLRAGKRLPKRATEIAVQFKKGAACAVQQPPAALEPNVLVLRIQPDEGISLRMSAKCRAQPADRTRENGFPLRTSFGKPPPRLTSACSSTRWRARQGSFARRDEVEEAWTFVDAIRAEWDKDSDDLAIYAAGTWGPSEADDLIKRHGATWRRL